MFRYIKIIFCGYILGFYATQLSAAEAVAVSPGDTDRSSTIANTCPTFSWSGMTGAERYELAVFQQIGDENRTYKALASGDSPVIFKILPAPALSWTPSSEMCFDQGASYVWFVRGLAAEQPGTWSKGKRFIVDMTSVEPDLEAAIVQALVTYLSDERTLRRVVNLLRKESNTVQIYGDNRASARMAASSAGISGNKSVRANTALNSAALKPKANMGAVKLSPTGTSYFTGGNLGIGTTNPNYKLDIEGNVFIRGAQGFNTAGDDAIAYFGHPAHNIRGEFGTGISVSTFGAANALTVREGTGNVGIGTTEPSEPLEVAGSGRAFFGDGGGASRKGLLIDGIQGNSAARLEGYDYGTSSGLDLVLNPLAGGNVGIGTTSPNYKLDIEGDVFVRGTQGFDAAGEDASVYLGHPAHNIRGEHGTGVLISTFGAANALTIREQSGAVGIGTTTPVQKLDVAGKIKIGVDTKEYTSTLSTYYPVEAFPIVSGGPVCNEAVRGSMFVGTVSVKPGEDLLCMCLRRGSEIGWYCFGP